MILIKWRCRFMMVLVEVGSEINAKSCVKSYHIRALLTSAEAPLIHAIQLVIYYYNRYGFISR